jgi:cytochrome oxidase Cu insertion factor (SCO1/SenC/PrrC family)
MLPVAALGAVLALTAFWWAFALWPLPSDTPAWVFKARTSCFGSASNGLPDTSGWLILTLQPFLMLSILFAGWGSAVVSGIRRLLSARSGRVTLGLIALTIVIGTAAAGWRVVSATPPADAFAVTDGPIPHAYPRLDRPAPPLALTNQFGETFTLTAFRGRPVIVTFAYAHCTTVCPVVVRDVLRVRRALPDLSPAVVIVTLDPERDVPSRLPAIARQWGVEADEFVVSGTVVEVEATLAAWGVARARDPRTGEVSHPRVVYLIDRTGQLAYATSGGPEAIGGLVRRM